MRIAIVGATGFVGAALTETLLGNPAKEGVPLIHNAGNAWALARRGLSFRTVDLLSPNSIQSAIDGCTHVVNCSRGGPDVMFKGLDNLIKQCRQQRVQKFVHLSSVAVYGDPPPPSSVAESAPTHPAQGSYGWMKLRQDQMIQGAVRSGLPAVVLCPPNILGPGSYFLLNILSDIDKGDFVLADDGSAPCCTVDVANLVHAIDLALGADLGDGERLFITDDESVSWRRVIDPLVRLTCGAPSVRSEAHDWLKAHKVEVRKQKLSPLRTAKHLISSDVRAALRQDPLLSLVDTKLRKTVANLGGRIEGHLRHFVEGPTPVRMRQEAQGSQNLSLSLQQLRGVMHSCERAKSSLGYEPVVSFDSSMEAFCKWYTQTQGMDSEFADLLQHLH